MQIQKYYVEIFSTPILLKCEETVEKNIKGVTLNKKQGVKSNNTLQFYEYRFRIMRYSWFIEVRTFYSTGAKSSKDHRNTGRSYALLQNLKPEFEIRHSGTKDLGCIVYNLLLAYPLLHLRMVFKGISNSVFLASRTFRIFFSCDLVSKNAKEEKNLLHSLIEKKHHNRASLMDGEKALYCIAIPNEYSAWCGWTARDLLWKTIRWMLYNTLECD